MEDYASFGILSGTCIGLSSNQFNQRYSMSKDKLFIINFNIRSFNANFDQFAVFLDELERAPDLIILTETWNSDDKNAKINGFKSFHCNRSFDMRGGGVSIYVNKKLNAKAIKISMDSLTDIEYIHVKLTFNRSGKILDAVGIYRPPNINQLTNFLDHLDFLLDSLGTNTYQILAGDLNICGLSNTVISNQLFNVMRAYSFMPHISRITRYNSHGTSTAIDHIWSNFGFNFDSGVFDDIFISDHWINFTLLPFLPEITKVITKFRNHSEQCIEMFADRLANFNLFFDLLSANLDFDAKFSLFFHEIDRIYKTCCPIKQSKRNFFEPFQ